MYSILTHTHDSSGLENIGICCSKITRPKVCLRVSVIRIFNFKLLMLRLSSWWFDDICRTNFARFRHQTLGRLIRYHYIKFILRISDGKGGRGLARWPPFQRAVVSVRSHLNGMSYRAPPCRNSKHNGGLFVCWCVGVYERVLREVLQ